MNRHRPLLTSFTLLLAGCATIDETGPVDQDLPPLPGFTVEADNAVTRVIYDVDRDGRWDWRARLLDTVTVLEINHNADDEPDIRLKESAEGRLQVQVNTRDGWQHYAEPAGEDWFDPQSALDLPAPLREALCTAIDTAFCETLDEVPEWRRTYERRQLEGFVSNLPPAEREDAIAEFCSNRRDVACRDDDKTPTPTTTAPAATPVCGPDATAQVVATLGDIVTKFQNSTAAQQDSMCGTVFSWDRKKYLNAFDIMPLFHYQACWYANKYPGCDIPPQATSTQPCEYTIEFAGGCFHSAVANYMQFGLIGKLCGKWRLTLVTYHMAYDGTKRWSNYWSNKGATGDPNLSQQSLMMNLGFDFESGSAGLDQIERTIAANKRLMTSQGQNFRHYYYCALTCAANPLQPDPAPWPFTLEPVFPRPASGCTVP